MIERYLFQREVVEDEDKVSHRVEMDFEAEFLTDLAEQFHSFLIASGFSYVSAVAQKSDGDVACSDGWEYSADDEDDDDDEYED